MKAPRILLIVGGGIAAYKACELVRLIRKGGGSVSCVLTDGGAQFITAMTLAALSENPVHTTLWDLKNESEMGHIQLSRQADLVVVCPATADLLAKMASGISDDLATTLLLATDKPVLAVPAMNVRMWQHEATQRNVEWLRRAGVAVMDPDEGAMACGEYGPGRLPEPEVVWQAIGGILGFETASAPPSQVAPAPPPPVFEEAIEPEPWVEEEPEHKSGLAGLFASIIPRSTSRKPVVEEDYGYEDLPLPQAEAWPEPDPDEVQAPESEGEEFLPEPDLAASPLLARKGKAAGAPPTDREAVNHEVNPMQAPPEAFAGELAAAPVNGGEEEFVVDPGHRPLAGKHVLITAGPTHEPIDPVRYIANRSSGRQGFAIAGWAAALGARVTLVAGPVSLATPPGVDRIDVQTAVEMSEAVKKTLPVDIAVMVAAVADWRVDRIAEVKMKKREMAPPALRLTENPDILANLAAGGKRPGLIVGFAAETDNVIEYAKDKRKRKGADWIVANDVSGDVMGGTHNRVHLVTAEGVESWDDLPKGEVARLLVERIADEVE
ncbi:peptidase [Croceicoccus estronivorus]|uniref:bifunctional phosphopantothenoylcysteine decarboxylase/phosphopantothenate synthase n=1 Tax=Croceicoccus estronivorus TaxID=1172626 RepID=UPI00082C8324|nr:bifunctional phosphopantothenoylcysteine decarboxylase/phosphopantothenate synthase [Croceicoccus estronivorus]OCC25449.1 peptidase [Croceicoccus estronivorus]